MPFVGAGVSQSVQWEVNGEVKRGPSWREVVDYAAKDLGFEHPSLARVRGTDLQILEYYVREKADSSARLARWLHDVLKAPDDAIRDSTIHTALAELANCNLFYTTNYDDYLERALEMHQRAWRCIAVEAHMGSASGEECQVVKFHGDLDHPSEMVLSESDYEKRLQLSTPMDYRFQGDLCGRVVLFLGYSFTDPNIAYLFRLFVERFVGMDGGVRGPRAYILVPDPSAFEKTLFEERKIQVIGIDRVEMTGDTVELLESMRS